MTTRRAHRRFRLRSRATVGFGVLAASIGLASVARAEPPSFAERHPELKAPDITSETKKETDARHKRATEADALGDAAFGRGDFKACEQQFAKVWMLSGRESINAAINLGVCESRLGYYLDAREHLTLALRGMEASRSDPKHAEQIAGMEEELKIAEAHLTMLGITGAPPGALISIGTKIKVTAPVVEKLVLYPGDYLVEVHVNGDVVRSDTFHANAGVAYTYRFTPPNPPPPPEPVRVGPRPLWLGIGGATAGALAALGAGLFFASKERLDEVATLRAQIGDLYGSEVGACRWATGAREELCKTFDATANSAATFHYAGIASLVLGGLVGAGTTAYGLWPRAAPPPPVAPPPPPPPFQVTARVVVSPGGAGLLLQGAW